MRRVLLFGLSANPPTGEGGHLGLVRWAAERREHPELGGELDAIWVLPVHRHAYEDKSDLAPFRHRLEMCRRCFEGRDLPVRVVVDDAERVVSEGRPSQPIGTIDVVEHLQGREPDARFGLLLGADTARDLLQGRWKRSGDLLSRVGLVVVPRAGFAPPSDLDLPIADDAPALGSVSSTQARGRVKRGRLREVVTPEVADYIETHGLYRSP